MSGRTFAGVFEGKQYTLQLKIDIEHGLLSKLEEDKVITTVHRQAIEVIFVTVEFVGYAMLYGHIAYLFNPLWPN